MLRWSAVRLTTTEAEVWSQVELIGFDPDPADACGSALAVGDSRGPRVRGIPMDRAARALTPPSPV